jgi:hypothetical protein
MNTMFSALDTSSSSAKVRSWRWLTPGWRLNGKVSNVHCSGMVHLLVKQLGDLAQVEELEQLLEVILIRTLLAHSARDHRRSSDRRRRSGHWVISAEQARVSSGERRRRAMFPIRASAP